MTIKPGHVNLIFSDSDSICKDLIFRHSHNSGKRGYNSPSGPYLQTFIFEKTGFMIGFPISTGYHYNEHEDHDI
jgi:hypothetical protein